MQGNENFDIFLSFNSRDRELANSVYSFLEQNELVVFFSDESLKGTPSFVKRINEALTSAKDFLLVTSDSRHVFPVSDENMLGSDWVADEIEKYIIINNNRSRKGQKKGKLVSFRTSNVNLEELPIDFQKDSTAIEQTNNSNCWDSLLGCFQDIQKNERTFSRSAFVEEWLNSQKKTLMITYYSLLGTYPVWQVKALLLLIPILTLLLQLFLFNYCISVIECIGIVLIILGGFSLLYFERKKQ